MSFTDLSIAGAGMPRSARAVVPTFVMLALLALAGCGFQPIHAQRSQASPEALAQIEIELIENRIGQILRNELLQRFHPRGASKDTRFSLRTTLTESLQDLGIRKNTVATRGNLTLTATFTISPRAGGDPLFDGTATSIISYNILTSDFATLSARADARRRGAREIADQITQWASVWLVQTGGQAVPSLSSPETETLRESGAIPGVSTGAPGSDSFPSSRRTTTVPAGQ